MENIVKYKKIERLHVITQDLAGIPHWKQAEKACKAGAKWIQLRVKNQSSYVIWKSIALATQRICKEYGATLIINDNVELAGEIEADGVHLGEHDMLPQDAVALLGDNFIIGGTAHTFRGIQFLSYSWVDYIGLGPFRRTSTKKLTKPTLGFSGFRNILDQCHQEKIKTPVISIGGLRPTDIPFLEKIGVDGYAVASGINQSADPIAACKQYIKVITK